MRRRLSPPPGPPEKLCRFAASEWPHGLADFEEWRYQRRVWHEQHKGPDGQSGLGDFVDVLRGAHHERERIFALEAAARETNGASG